MICFSERHRVTYVRVNCLLLNSLNAPFTIKSTYAFADNWAQHMFTNSSFHANVCTMETNRTEPKNSRKIMMKIFKLSFVYILLLLNVLFAGLHTPIHAYFELLVPFSQRTKEKLHHGDEWQQQKQQPLVHGLIEIKSTLWTKKDDDGIVLHSHIHSTTQIIPPMIFHVIYRKN